MKVKLAVIAVTFITLSLTGCKVGAATPETLEHSTLYELSDGKLVECIQANGSLECDWNNKIESSEVK